MDMNEKMRKAFIELNKAIDSDIDKTYQKLYDKYVNLELSHNRKKKALKQIMDICEEVLRPAITFDFCDDKNFDLSKATTVSEFDLRNHYAFQRIYWRCLSALFSDGRVNERSLVKCSKKGGAK